jgi:hypothetical protein
MVRRAPLPRSLFRMNYLIRGPAVVQLRHVRTFTRPQQLPVERMRTKPGGDLNPHWRGTSQARPRGFEQSNRGIFRCLSTWGKASSWAIAQSRSSARNSLRGKSDKSSRRHTLGTSNPNVAGESWEARRRNDAAAPGHRSHINNSKFFGGRRTSDGVKTLEISRGIKPVTAKSLNSEDVHPRQPRARPRREETQIRREPTVQPSRFVAQTHFVRCPHSPRNEPPVRLATVRRNVDIFWSK